MQRRKFQRRQFLSWLGLGGVLSFVSQNWSKIAQAAKKPTYLTAGTVDALTKAGSLVVTLKQKDQESTITVFPNPTDPKQLLAMNLACTHNGCTVNWDGKAKALLCPCHGSAFDLTGKVVKSPAKKPLASYPVVKQGKNILVQVG
jgi:cytochrome b6-f complex iron-sulfur subunit